MFPWYKNQSETDWFLYDENIGRERVKLRSECLVSFVVFIKTTLVSVDCSSILIVKFRQLKSLVGFDLVNLLTVYQQENNVRLSNKITWIVNLFKLKHNYQNRVLF